MYRQLVIGAISGNLCICCGLLAVVVKVYYAFACLLQGAQVKIDQHLPDVLSFPSGTDLHDHPLVTSSCLILQVSHALSALTSSLHSEPSETISWHLLNSANLLGKCRACAVTTFVQYSVLLHCMRSGSDTSNCLAAHLCIDLCTTMFSELRGMPAL